MSEKERKRACAVYQRQYRQSHEDYRDRENEHLRYERVYFNDEQKKIRREQGRGRTRKWRENQTQVSELVLW